MGTNHWRRGLARGIAGLAFLAVAGCAAVPEPLTADEIRSRIEGDRAALLKGQEPVAKPITLSEAIARAVKHNLDHKIKVMESALAQGELDFARWELLPRVVADAGYTTRSNEAGSSSKSLINGKQSLESSTSSDKAYPTADLTVTWNVLDFGVSWLRGKQLADRKLIAEERRRKVVHNIVQDVRTAYWKVVSAQRLLPKVEALEVEARAAIEASKTAESRRLRAANEALDYQMGLLETVREIGALKRDLVLAKAELASLMNLAPGTPFQVAAPDTSVFAIPELPAGGIDGLQEAALRNRPELREEDYNERISVLETRKAILRMLPGIELNTDIEYSGNSFLYNQHWVEGGVKLTWNLMNLLSGFENMSLNEAKEELVRQRRIALSMAAMTQVSVAMLRYNQAREDFKLAYEMAEVAGRLKGQADSARQVRAESALESIRRASKAIFVELQRDSSYSELQNAAGRIQVSVGADPLPESIGSDDLPTLAAAIDRSLDAWRENKPSLLAEQPRRSDDRPAEQAVAAPAETARDESWVGWLKAQITPPQ